MLMLKETKSELGVENNTFLKNAKNAKTIRIFLEKYLQRTVPVMKLVAGWQTKVEISKSNPP
jgi:hypothetical protein